MLLGVAGYAEGAEAGREEADRFDREAAAVGEVDRGSEELRDFAIQYTVYAVSYKTVRLFLSSAALYN